jgi:hypothetical protein
MNHNEIEYEDVDWIKLAQKWVQCLVIVNTGTNLRVAENTENFLTSLASMYFSRNILLHGVKFV